MFQKVLVLGLGKEVQPRTFLPVSKVPWPLEGCVQGSDRGGPMLCLFENLNGLVGESKVLSTPVLLPE